MSDLARQGAVLGLLLGVGLWLVWGRLPRNRRHGLADRVLPYLRDAPVPSRLLRDEGAGPGVVGVLARPLLRDLGTALERALGGRASVQHRLVRAGNAPDVDRFRAEQVLWGVAGAVLGGAIGAALAVSRGSSVVPVVLLTAMGLGLGVTGRDHLLSQRATRRERRMLAEFPTVAELLALAVGAGEGAVGALDRVCRSSRGELADELRRCLADARSGANLPSALQGLADRTGLAGVRRFVDGVVVAVERGTPLADVLRAQAQDVREEGRRALMEAGGRKEIAMMIPVVFLILPVTVLFAVFPGFTYFRFTL